MMGGGLRASVGVMMWNEISLLLYPPAAANAVVLLVIVLILVSLMMRVVDLKKEL
jgi:putative spermidine/putrescine transport system permease protein